MPSDGTISPKKGTVDFAENMHYNGANKRVCRRFSHIKKEAS